MAVHEKAGEAQAIGDVVLDLGRHVRSHLPPGSVEASAAAGCFLYLVIKGY